MSEKKGPARMSEVALAAVMAAVLVAGCEPSKTEGAHTNEPGAVQVAGKQPAVPAAPFTKANELGLIPVLEYHRFGPKEERWTRTPANFKKDLAFLYNNGYVLVNMRDVAARKIDLPAGKKPVVLTFDDATEGQFRYMTENGKIERDASGKPVIDPDSAVGMLDAFYAKHPDFGRASTFYVLPSGFEQDAGIAEKFKYLDATGRELGSHTWGHDNLSTLSAAQVEKSLSKLQAFVDQQMGKPYPMTTLALPYGIGPKDAAGSAKVVQGGGAASYHHMAMLLVGANPAYSPYHVSYKSKAVARIQAIDSEFSTWFNRKPGSTAVAAEPWAPYVSDGDPSRVTFPEKVASKLNRETLLPGQVATPVDPNKPVKPVADLKERMQAAGKPGESTLAHGVGAKQAGFQEGAPSPSPVVSPAGTTEAKKLPAVAGAAGTDTHPGYGLKLPTGGRYEHGKITHTVAAGDSVEAIAYKYVRFTDAYTYPGLAKAIRAANGGERPLKIGETLVVPQVRQAPPRPALVKKEKTFEAKGVYITGTTAGSIALWDIVKALKAHGGNTVVFDAKDMSGVVSYKSEVPLAKQIGAYRGGMVSDLPKMIERLHAEGIHVVARLTLFHDQRLAQSKPQLALRSKRTGAPWKENGYLLWVDPSRPEVQDYNLAIAKELIANGVDEIQYDYVRFPAQGDTPDIAWSTMKTQPKKHEVITAWVKRAYGELHPSGVLVSADVYGVVAWDQGIDVRITGQKLEEMGHHLDAVSPMLYPSHFYGDFDHKAYPPDHPAYFVGEGVKRVAKKTAGSGVVIRPWLQAFPYRIRNYGPGYVAVQINAGDKNGGNGWLLWNAENNYKVGFAGVSASNKQAGARVASR